jgi:hypothetical protein
MKFDNIEEIFKKAAENGAEFKSMVIFWLSEKRETIKKRICFLQLFYTNHNFA